MSDDFQYLNVMSGESVFRASGSFAKDQLGAGRRVHARALCCSWLRSGNLHCVGCQDWGL